MKEFVTLMLREKEWTFRALDLDQIEQLEQQFITVSAVPANSPTLPKEAISAIAQIALASLQCKHQELTLESVRKLLTIATVQTVINAVRGVSELEPQPGEEPAGQS